MRPLQRKCFRDGYLDYARLCGETCKSVVVDTFLSCEHMEKIVNGGIHVILRQMGTDGIHDIRRKRRNCERFFRSHRGRCKPRSFSVETMLTLCDKATMMSATEKSEFFRLTRIYSVHFCDNFAEDDRDNVAVVRSHACFYVISWYAGGCGACISIMCSAAESSLSPPCMYDN